MDPFTGLTRALDYIEAHLSGELDCAAAAREAAMSPYQFQRVFGVLCGCPLGEYVRRRRLTLAGAELAAGRPRVIDVSLKYGYDNPESFARAFSRFHGVSPSQVQCGAPLRAFSRVSVRLIMEGGQMMNYSIEERDAMILTGYTRRFWGAPGGDQREDQERDFYVHTRAEQYLLRGLKQIRGDAADYNVISNISDDGYDFSIAAHLDGDVRAPLRRHDPGRARRAALPRHRAQTPALRRVPHRAERISHRGAHPAARADLQPVAARVRLRARRRARGADHPLVSKAAQERALHRNSHSHRTPDLTI